MKQYPFSENVLEYMRKNDLEKLDYGYFVMYIHERAHNRPKEWRYGQAIFNYMEADFGDIARQVQFIDGVDCFYADGDCNDNINDFVDRCWDRFKAIQEAFFSEK